MKGFCKKDIPFLTGTIIIIFICLFFYSSRYKEIAEIMESKKKINEEVLRKEAAEEQLASMKMGMKKLRQKLALYEERLPQNIKIDDFIRQLERIERKSGFLISSIEPHKIREKELYNEVPVTLKAEASYEETYKFIHYLNEIPRLNRIESVEIERLNDETNQCNVKINLKVFTAGKGN
ncbi:MAG: hypothetical protein D6734_05070 [Candidatus Schekmanbacteria bacterium]|nr:MAG: hypothetical protein D6734_05070 [Candidatus Schekmanbacteria bacterium]